MNAPLGAVSSSRRSIQIEDAATRQSIVRHDPGRADRHHCACGFAVGQKCDVVIMVGRIMPVTMIGMHHIDHFFVDMTMLGYLILMFGHDLPQIR